MFDRGQEERRRRRGEKLDLALNSIEGERSQSAMAAEGLLERLVKSVANICIRSRTWMDRKWVWALERGC